MKKIALVLILALAISFVNAQDKTTTTTPTTTTTGTTTTTKATGTQQNGNPRTPVKIADLPKTITDHIAKNYVGYTAKNAFKIDKNNTITYRVLVAKDTTQLSLIYDATGKFVSSKPASQRMMGTKGTSTGVTKPNNVGTKKDSTKK